MSNITLLPGNEITVTYQDKVLGTFPGTIQVPLEIPLVVFGNADLARDLRRIVDLAEGKALVERIWAFLGERAPWIEEFSFEYMGESDDEGGTYWYASGCLSEDDFYDPSVDEDSDGWDRQVDQWNANYYDWEDIRCEFSPDIMPDGYYHKTKGYRSWGGNWSS